MPVTSLSITSAQDETAMLAARQQTIEGKNGGELTQSIAAGLAAGKSVTALRELNTNAILRLQVGSDVLIDKFAEANAEEARRERQTV